MDNAKIDDTSSNRQCTDKQADWLCRCCARRRIRPAGSRLLCAPSNARCPRQACGAKAGIATANFPILARLNTGLDICVTPFGKLTWQGRTHRCALGQSGIRTNKREGDGATPSGCFELQGVLYRADRLNEPQTTLSVRSINPNDGWCDDPNNLNYNLPVTLPFAGSHERLWRDDALYDLLVTLKFNFDPPVAGAGSAIFLHVAAPNFSPTAGCVALACDTLCELLADCTPGDRLCISPPHHAEKQHQDADRI